MTEQAAPKEEQPEIHEAEATPIDEQQAKIDQLTQDVAHMRDQWMRAVAEMENIRKRAQREVEDASKFAASNFARDMVDVLENLTRASATITDDARAQNDLLKTLGEGVDLTRSELLAIFARHGITRVDPKGHKFDHNLHQAVVQTERTDIPAGTIIDVVQAGYTHHDRLLRPAMVVVSKQPEAPKSVDTSA